ncbi:MAG TPA: hypothetical protein VIM33_04180, partial [Gaiellaceae bacterium]
MDVAAEVVSGLDVGDRAIGGVVDRVRDGVCTDLCPAAPPSQHRSTAIALNPEVGDALRVERQEPDDLPLV